MAKLGETIANLGTVWESKVAPKIQNSVNLLDKAVLNLGKVGNYLSFGDQASQGGGPNNQVAPKPPGSINVTPRAAAGMAAGGQIAMGVAQAMPGTNMYVQQDLLTNRARFFGMGRPDTTSTFIDANGNRVGFKMGGAAGGISSENNNVTNLQNTLNQRGTILDQLDAARALIAAQGMGLAGATNFNQVMVGNAAMSNITPGIGIQGSTQAYGAVQQGRNVNMLRAIGIQIRGADGSMKPMPQIIDEIWSKLNREKIGNQPLTYQDVLISLQPGNALDTMLNTYFGNDQMLRTQVEQGLLLKAKTGGTRPLESISKKELQNLGVSTAAVTSLSNRNAAASRVLQQTAGFGAAGFTLSNQAATDLAKIANAMTPLLDVVAGLSTFIGGITGIGNGLLGKVMAPIATLFGFFKREKGGPVDDKVPYIVGEKGPELFVPNSDGMIIPNHELPPGITRGSGGGVKAGGADARGWTADEFAKRLAQGLGVSSPSEGAVDALKTWMRFEGGHWKNAATYNPLNTTLGMPGSKSMNSVGVKAYTSWDQGLQATINTLTGANAQSRGYTAIVDAMKTGNKDAVLTAINNSAWRTGKTGGAGAYKGMAGSSGGDYGNSPRDPSSGQMSGQSTDSSSVKSLKDFLAKSNTDSVKSFIGDKQTGSGGGQSTYNFGGVNITVSGAKSPTEVADAIASIFADNAIKKKLMGG